MMAPLRLLVAVTVLAGAPACAERKQSAPVPIYVGGRVAVERDGSMLFGWPGVYFEGRFKGTGLLVKLHNGTGRLRLLVDGVEKERVNRPGAMDLRVAGLSDGEHVFRLEKLSETQHDATRLIGFYPIDGGVPLSPPTRTGRQIEFIGDSHSVGYGDTSSKRACTPDELRDTTDTQLAFGPVLARRLGADYRVNAYSGFGIVRNYNGSRPGETMPGLYRRILPSASTPVETDPKGWHPQIIVINLGTNDFSTSVHKGEPWADRDALRADYRVRYVKFVRDVMARQPKARLILMGSDTFIADVNQVATELGSNAYGGVSTVRVSGMDVDGCDWHPSLKDQRLMADLLQAEIARVTGPAK